MLLCTWQAAAATRERALGAVDAKARDYTSDVTTEQQKALSGVVQGTRAGQSKSPLDRRSSRQGRPKQIADIASSAAGGDSSDDAAASTTAKHYNSSAQFADPGRLQSQEATTAAHTSKAAGNTGDVQRQVAMKCQEGKSALGDAADGTQRAAQKFKLSSGKVPLCSQTYPCILQVVRD